MFSDQIQASRFILFSALTTESIWEKNDVLRNGGHIEVKEFFRKVYLLFHEHSSVWERRDKEEARRGGY